MPHVRCCSSWGRDAVASRLGLPPCLQLQPATDPFPPPCRLDASDATQLSTPDLSTLEAVAGLMGSSS